MTPSFTEPRITHVSVLWLEKGGKCCVATKRLLSGSGENEQLVRLETKVCLLIQV